MTAKEKALKHVAPAAKPVVSRYIDEHTRQACKEQRKICAKSFPSHEHSEILEKIINAPEPELE